MTHSMTPHPPEIILLESDPTLARQLGRELAGNGLDIRHAHTTEQALQLLERDRALLVISDLQLCGPDYHLLRSCKQQNPRPAFLVLTAAEELQHAVGALRQGADELLTRPLNMEHFSLVVQRLLDTRKLRNEMQRFQELLQEESFYGMLGQSRGMRELFSHIRLLAKADGPVLVIGESGTGKELVARAVHEHSERKDQPFLAVNCASIPAELLESEFFGHAAGSFTGARRSRKGLFLQADGGTLFLDEISEMPLPLQAKLLRVLQEGSFRAVGADLEQMVDVRIIAASNQPLQTAAGRTGFRDDLFFRLETFTLHVPPLREREEDLELLAARFIARFASRAGRQIQGLSGAALECLHHYPFPGNVRELQNAMERAVTFCHGSMIEPAHLPQRIRNHQEKPQPVQDALPAELLAGPVLPSLAELELRYIHHVLEQVDGNKRRAAALLGIGRRTLYRKLEEGS